MTSTSEPTTPAAVDPNEFRSSTADVEGAVDDLLNMLDDDGEPLVKDAPAPDPAPSTTPAAAPAVVATPPAESTPVVSAPAVPAQAPDAGITPPQPVVATPGQPVDPNTPAAVTPPADPNAQTPAAPAVQPQAAASSDVFGQLQSAVQQQRAELEPHLAQLYTPPEADMEEWHEHPEKVLGKLAARLHMEVVQNTLATLAAHQPAAVAGILQAQKQYEALENQFFEKWPQLKKADPAHKQVIAQTAAAFNRVNPNADVATRINQIGAAAIVALGLLPTAPAPVAAPQPAAPVPFTPATNGSAGPPGGQVLDGWAAIAEQLGNNDGD